MSLTEAEVPATVSDEVLAIVDRFLTDVPSNAMGDFLKVDLVNDFCLDIRLALTNTDNN